MPPSFSGLLSNVYCKLLNQAVKEIKGEEQEAEREVKIDVAVNAFIPKDYIESSDARFRVYNLLIAIKSEDDRKAVLKQICDVYGKNLPQEVENLSKISLLRHYCQKLGISKVQINSFNAVLEFYSKESVLNEKITEVLSNCGIGYILNFNNSPTIMFDFEDKSIFAKLNQILELLLALLSKKSDEK